MMSRRTWARTESSPKVSDFRGSAGLSRGHCSGGCHLQMAAKTERKWPSLQLVAVSGHHDGAHSFGVAGLFPRIEVERKIQEGTSLLMPQQCPKQPLLPSFKVAQTEYTNDTHAAQSTRHMEITRGCKPRGSFIHSLTEFLQ